MCATDGSSASAKHCRTPFPQQQSQESRTPLSPPKPRVRGSSFLSPRPHTLDSLPFPLPNGAQPPSHWTECSLMPRVRNLSREESRSRPSPRCPARRLPLAGHLSPPDPRLAKNHHRPVRLLQELRQVLELSAQVLLAAETGPSREEILEMAPATGARSRREPDPGNVFCNPTGLTIRVVIDGFRDLGDLRKRVGLKSRATARAAV